VDAIQHWHPEPQEQLSDQYRTRGIEETEKTYPLAPQLEQEPPAPPLLHSFTRVYTSAIITDLEDIKTYHVGGRHRY
jgi:hypothetical protein